VAWRCHVSSSSKKAAMGASKVPVLWNMGLSALGKCGKTLGKCWEDAGK